MVVVILLRYELYVVVFEGFFEVASNPIYCGASLRKASTMCSPMHPEPLHSQTVTKV